LKADCFHPLKRVAEFVISTAAKGDQESVFAELDVVAHHDQIHPNEFNREGIDNEFHLDFNSLPAKSVLAGTKLVLFGRYVLKFYVVIVQ
jgi:hypothetical protein